ncbi:MAG TPA: hypothetical protein VM756_17510, partial [Burkholderiales bacterium]|nr:hypothetical protein [Burkholderiales bacterium]
VLGFCDYPQDRPAHSLEVLHHLRIRKAHDLHTFCLELHRASFVVLLRAIAVMAVTELALGRAWIASERL